MNILEVRNLKKHYKVASEKGGEKKTLKAVDGVSFILKQGEILGVVGESGCGKSTLGKTVLRLHGKDGGDVHLLEKDLFALSAGELKDMRLDAQMIFQDPFSSLNPRKRVKDLIGQPLRIHKKGTKEEIDRKVASLMTEVGLDPLYRNRFAHQFSGGQRQRIGIARALALNPRFIVCDEAVSALDVSVQAQIINLLLDLREKHDLTYMFIAHDLAVVEFISTRIIVMYLGRIVEMADKEDLVARHRHPYTKALFQAFPSTDPEDRERKEKVVVGDVPSPIDPPSGCHFHPRCPYAEEKCRREYPPLEETGPGHFSACWKNGRED